MARNPLKEIIHLTATPDGWSGGGGELKPGASDEFRNKTKKKKSKSPEGPKGPKGPR